MYWGSDFVFQSNFYDYQLVLDNWTEEAKKRRKGMPHTVMPTRTDHKSQKHRGIMVFLNEETSLP